MAKELSALQFSSATGQQKWPKVSREESWLDLKPFETASLSFDAMLMIMKVMLFACQFLYQLSFCVVIQQLILSWK